MPMNALSKRLQNLSWIPWRWRKRNGLLNTVLYIRFRRLWLRQWLKRQIAGQPDDISVIIGTYDRRDFRLIRALQSLRQQTHPAHLIKITVVDYGNPPDIAQWVEQTSKDHQARYIRTEQRGCWNRSHCMNIAIKEAKTQFILTSDVDVMFAPNYIEQLIGALKKDSLQVVRAPTHDLPESCTAQLEAVDQPVDMDELIKAAELRPASGFGISGTYTAYYHLLRSYDEYYERWGAEDNDIRNRFNWLGLEEFSLEGKSYYLHQWHPRYEGFDEATLEAALKRNREYLHHAHTLKRNLQGWGEIITTPATTPTNTPTATPPTA